MQVEPLPHSGLYRLVEDETIHGMLIPAGTEWDGASIPRVVWTGLGITPFHPSVMRASLLHDHLYALRSGIRRLVDRAFWRILLEDGVPADAAALMYASVRIGGRAYWSDDEDRASAALDPGWPSDDLL